MILPSFVSLTCGQDIYLPSFKGLSPDFPLIIQCTVYNGTGPITLAAFKNGVSYIGPYFNLQLNASTTDNSYFGTYAFVLVSGRCGHATAVARILRQG